MIEALNLLLPKTPAAAVSQLLGMGMGIAAWFSLKAVHSRKGYARAILAVMWCMLFALLLIAAPK